MQAWGGLPRGSVQQRSTRRAHSGRGQSIRLDGTADRPLFVFRSWAQDGARPKTTECPDKVARDLLDGIAPREHANILIQEPLADPSERPQEIAQACPQPFQRVVVDFPYSIAVIVPCPLPHAVADRGVPS